MIALGGCVEILIALVHFVWPFDLIKTGEYACLSGQNSDLLVLSSLSIGLCLLVFGALSIYFSRRLRAGERSALTYSFSQAVLWGVRAIFEVFFPVLVPMYVIYNPTVYILPLTVLLCLVFLSPLFFWKPFEDGKETS